MKDYFRGETADRLFKELVEERKSAAPHGRLIDADALIKRATTYANDNEGWSCTSQADADFVEYVNKQPTVTIDKWIPCSERLPEDTGRYLVFYKLMSDTPWITVMNYGRIDDDPKKVFYSYDSEYGEIPYDNIIAWMPLPEAYSEV